MKFKINNLKQLASLKRAIMAWIAAAWVILLAVQNNFTSKTFAHSFVLVGAVGIVLAFYAIASIIDLRRPEWGIDNYMLASAICLYAFTLSLKEQENYYFTLGLMAVLVIAGSYLMRENRLAALEKIHPPLGVSLGLVAAAGIFCAAFVASVTVLRHWTYSTPCFDFGIFVQMYHNMKETLLATVTCERDRVLSHFGVHVSPIYYLLLPVYWLFPYAETLQIGQAVVVYSALIPLFLIARRRNMTPGMTAVICIMAAFYPALAGGCMYDIHENCFLPPLLLWMFYFHEKKQPLPMYIFVLLTLMVKEDAAVYIGFAAIYFMVEDKDWKNGLAMMAAAVVWFLGVTWYLENHGMGVMTTRYDNFIVRGEGLSDMLKNLFKNPALAIAEAFNQDTLHFLLLMLLPTGLLPFATKKLSRYLLFLPMVLVNLMPDYVYQHSIYYQYIFGASAFLLYASLLNLSELSGQAKQSLAALAVAGSILSFNTMITNKSYYFRTYEVYRETYDTLNEALELVPADASVRASTFLVPHLAQREVIFQITSNHVTEYVVYDLRYDDPGYGELILDRYQGYGYEAVEYIEEVIAIFRMPDWTEDMATWIVEEAKA